jgi:hypothetical protein
MLLKEESGENEEEKHTYVEKFHEMVKSDEDVGPQFDLKIVWV